MLKEKQINPRRKVKQNKEIFLKAKFSFYKALSFPKRSFTNNLSLEQKALSKKLVFLVKVFACKKVFCKKEKVLCYEKRR
uniref:Uncharacterized protein n=1 Tax=Candidatus Methanophagaceae archaeon ANME-1 ERB6 TaxID=2759912 RepID=A0A7G9YVI6_9EURY|nr:hypothetical protein HGMICNAC_00022 [Methanosarcinales archaeon ANME-1 ERB6]